MESHEDGLQQRIFGMVATGALTITILWALVWPGCRAPAPGTTQPPAAVSRAAQPPAHAVATGSAGAGSAGAGQLGAMIERPLPGGARVRVPELGVEGRLIAFIEDASRPADKSTWFDFDRLAFETGSATLGPASHDQLRAVAEILKAYPRTRLKVGGYTDNVGQPLANQRLSEQRAASVRGELSALGVAPERLESEGYGEQHPIADNATAEGRAKNRRISMRLLEK